MKIYLVGGAVRDALLGLPIKERDWVVVGATPAEMITLGYLQVGKAFPVFIHPQTGEEYALARLERKIHPGYTGFEFDTSKTVTLEEDLKRRDLTINAMAQTLEGELIDPYHGKTDLEHKVLRHVSAAFAEDPVRILRTARFLARYYHLGFHVAKETIQLMQQMVAKGEVNALVSERVWKELERALSEKNPEQFFILLSQVHALPILFNTIDLNGMGMKALQASTHLTSDTTVRFAALTHDLENASISMRELRNAYRIPNEFYELARLTAFHYEKALAINTLAPEAILELLNALDYFRRENRFHAFLKTVSAIAAARGLPFDPSALLAFGEAAKSVAIKALIEQGYTHLLLAEKIKQERLEKIAALIKAS